MSQPREEIISKKNRAKSLMSDPLIKEFFDVADTQLYRRWCDTSATDKLEREEIYLQQLGLKAFREYMIKCIIDGEGAERDLRRDGKI